jgi:hypothetical protein
MRARAIRRWAEPRHDADTATAAGRPSIAALVFLHGRDADDRLRKLVAERAQARPVLGELDVALLSGRGFELLGFRCLGDWSRERLGVGARTVREWARVWRALEVASAFREGRITLLQAEVLLRGGSVEAREKLELALRVTLRRLEDEVLPRRVAFWAPPEVAALFEALVARVGLEAMLDHAIATWLEAGRQFHDYADFERDGYRCTVPGCTARRNLQSHHIWFRSARGPDVAWNRTTLCAYHHHRGVHAGSLALHGRAPDGLVYTLGVGRFGSGDVKLDVG